MENDLSDTEKRAFRATVDTGLWDVMIAAVVSTFAIAPLLSGRLGDFWSAAVFLPVWGLLWVVLQRVRARVVEPRVGVVRFGAVRKARLWRFTGILLAVNIVALVAGAVFAIRPGVTWAPVVVLGVIVLVGFSMAAWFLDIPRYFGYGVLLVAAALAGEALFQRGLASHHGYPVAFGASAALIAVVGLLRFAKYLPPRRAEADPLAGDRGHG